MENKEEIINVGSDSAQGVIEDETVLANVVDSTVEWEAPEYYSANKNSTWYITFSIVVIVLLAFSIFFMQSITFSLLIAIMAISLVVYTKRPSPVIQYVLSVKQGLYIGDKLHNLQDYKAFTVYANGPHKSFSLLPIKRFAPGVSVYFPAEKGEEIVDILAKRLPMEEPTTDILENITNKLKF